MKIQVLFAAMYQTDILLPEKSNVRSHSVVINQTDFTKYPNLCSKDSNTIFISNQERGISKSRNEALKYAESDICLLADDDLYYEEYFEDIRHYIH